MMRWVYITYVMIAGLARPLNLRPKNKPFFLPFPFPIALLFFSVTLNTFLSNIIKGFGILLQTACFVKLLMCMRTKGNEAIKVLLELNGRVVRGIRLGLVGAQLDLGRLRGIINQYDQLINDNVIRLWAETSKRDSGFIPLLKDLSK